MDSILPICSTCRKTERVYSYLMCYAQSNPTVSQNDPPVAQNHHLKMMTQHSKKRHISENEPHLSGDFWLPSPDPNEIMKTLLEILGFLYVYILFEREKKPLHDWENCVFLKQFCIWMESRFQVFWFRGFWYHVFKSYDMKGIPNWKIVMGLIRR